MSASSILSGMKSHIPIVRSSSSKQETKSSDSPKSKKWTDKLRRRSSSTLALFNVTHKVPSHIVSPKSPTRETIKSGEELPPFAHHRSNLELFSSFADESDFKIPPYAGPDQSFSSCSEQDLSKYFQEEQQQTSLAPDDLYSSPFAAQNGVPQKSASISNINSIDINENFDFDQDFQYGFADAPASLPPSHSSISSVEHKNDRPDLPPKPSSHHLQQIAGLNSSLRTQFRSEQNLLNSHWSPYENGMHSLDHNFANKGGKFSYDISTIKELPEERSESPAKHILDQDVFKSKPSSFEPVTKISRRPSITEKYRSMQDLRQNLTESQQPMSLTASQSNILFQTIPEDDVHDFTTPFRNSSVDAARDCFRSFQDLRDPMSYSNENLAYSLDYHALNNRQSFASIQDLSKDSLQRPTNYSGSFAERDISVSMIDGLDHHFLEQETHNFMTKKGPSSKIPKRRHTITVQDMPDFGGFSQNKGRSLERSSSVHGLSQVSSDGRAVAKKQTQAETSHERSKSADGKSSAIKGPLKERTSTSLDRKKGCVGCQHKRDRKPVVRQQSLPANKVNEQQKIAHKVA